MSKALLRFVGVFFGCLLAFSAFAAATELQNRLGLVERTIAAAATAMAQAAGARAEVQYGNVIVTGSASLLVNHECTGLFVFAVLVSFIVAYPAPWWHKLAGMAVGLTALTAVNIARIATLVRLVELYPGLFDYFHEYVWQGVFLMLTTLYAMTWVERVQR